MDEIEQDTSGFMPVAGIAQITGIMAVVLTGIWMGHFRDGFAWQSDPKKEFNWHPMLMVLGLIYLYGNGILVYRVGKLTLPSAKNVNSDTSLLGILMYRLFRNEKKRKLKLIHAGVMLSSFFFTVIALKAAFDSHNLADPPIPNLYSLHSWMGMTTVLLFSAQWVSGLVTFLFPGLASHLRAAYLPIHVSFGILIFVMACATSLTGITEKLLFSLKGEYGKRAPEGVMANWIGILIILFGTLIVYLATNIKFKRLERPEDSLLLQEASVNE